MKSGSNEEMLKDIAAQYATIVCAQELINRQARKPSNGIDNALQFGGWVYSMADLKEWVKLFSSSNKKEEKTDP